MLLAFLDWTWNSTPWITWLLVGVIAFALIYLLLKMGQAKQASGGGVTQAPSLASTIAAGFASPAVVAAPRLAPSANPYDVKNPLESLSQLCLMWGQTEIALVLTHVANGDESEAHRAIRELALRYSSPRAITAAAKPIVLRHLEELRDDVEVKRILDRIKATP